MVDPRATLEAALSPAYRIERELGQGGMAGSGGIREGEAGLALSMDYLDYSRSSPTLSAARSARSFRGERLPT